MVNNCFARADVLIPVDDSWDLIEVKSSTRVKEDHLEDVLVDGQSVCPVTSYTFENIGNPHTIQAMFGVDTYTITPATKGNGTIDPANSSVVEYGSTYTCKFTPDSNYHIEDVIVDGNSVGSVTSYTFSGVDSDHTIIAKFAINSFTITASSSENGSISPVGSIELAHSEDQIY